MSKPCKPPGMSSITIQFFLLSKLSATIWSTGRNILSPYLSKASFAQSNISFSTIELPILIPLAFKNVYATPPPRRTLSASSIKLLRACILSLIFPPPTITTNGRSGFSRILVRNLSSLLTKKPASLCSNSSAIP